MKKILFNVLVSCLFFFLSCGFQVGDDGLEVIDEITYKVSVNASGLSLPYAQNVVLQINADENLTLSSDQSYDFNTLLSTGDAFNITIFSQSVLQNCSLDNASGLIENTNIEITLTCTDKSWVHPSSLTDNISPDGQGSSETQVAMDDNGNAIVVWKQSDGSDTQIFKSEYRNGAWTHPSGLSDNISPDTQNASFPQVAMDNNGNAIIVWEQDDGSNQQIFKSEYRNGSWMHPSGLSDNISPDSFASTPDVAMDNNGNAIITWYQYDNNFWLQVFKSEYRNGSWTHPNDNLDNISPDLQNVVDPPKVAMDDNGNAIIAWNQNNSTDIQIYKSEYRNGTWTHPADLLIDNISPDTEAALNPQVAMDNNGNAIIVWEQDDGNDTQIFKSEYRNSAWIHPSSLSDNISPDTEAALNPQVAMDDNGNAIITWLQTDSGLQIFKSEYRDGSWMHPSGLSDNISPNAQNAFDPKVAMDDNGNAIITWHQYDGSVIQIFKSEYRNGSWTHPSGLSDNISPNDEDSFYPQVAMDNNGNAIITWSQSDSSDNQIFKSEFR